MAGDKRPANQEKLGVKLSYMTGYELIFEKIECRCWGYFSL